MKVMTLTSGTRGNSRCEQERGENSSRNQPGEMDNDSVDLKIFVTKKIITFNIRYEALVCQRHSFGTRRSS